MSPSGLFRRHPANPLITAKDYRGANSIFNSAVLRVDGVYHAVLRVEIRDGASVLVRARSDDGIGFEIDPEVILAPECEPYASQFSGHNFDPRLNEVEGEYYLTYAAGTPVGCTIGMARTTDFFRYEPMEITAPARNRNSVLFSRKINGRYARLERPFGAPWSESAHIWYSESPDLEFWGRYRYVMGPDRRWNSQKVGAGPPPILTEHGWLLIYHGVRKTCSGMIYAVGVCLLDPEEPWKVIRRPTKYVIAPIEPYERVGDTPNAVFPTAAVHHPESDELWIYYGCADSGVALAIAKRADLVDYCLNED